MNRSRPTRGAAPAPPAPARPVEAAAPKAGGTGNLQTLRHKGLHRPLSVAPAGSTLERQADAQASAFAARPVRDAGAAPRSGTLPPGLRQDLEAHFDADLSALRLHTGAEAAADAAALGARAFAVGPDIGFAAGGPDLASGAGRRLLAHEVAHVVQHARGLGHGQVHLEPDQATPPAPATLADYVRETPPGFSDAALDAAYQKYLRSETAAAGPTEWALRQTVGAPRERLVQLLGPDYAKGQRSGLARPPLDVSAPVAPAGYDAARQQQDLARLQAGGAELTARLGGLQFSAQSGMSIGAGHQSILQGNVGEVLARPLLEQALAEVRTQYPDAQLFLHPSAQLRIDADHWTQPLQFTDGIIGVIEPAGLRILRVAEIKSGEAGGLQGQEQVHRWIEGHATTGLRILLPGVARTFEYGPDKHEVLGMARAPRLVVVPSDARFAGPRGQHGTTAQVIPLRLEQSSAEIAYLTAATAQRLLLESQARQILAMARDQPLQPQPVENTMALQEAATIERLQHESRGLALVNGVIYRVGFSATARTLERLPLQPLQLEMGRPLADGTQSAPRAALPPGPDRGGSQRASGPSGPGQPFAVLGMPGFAELAPGVSIPTNVINTSGRNLMVEGRVVAPSQPVELREGDIVVRGSSARWEVCHAQTGEPLASLHEGGRFYTVVSGRSMVTIDAQGRVSVGRGPQLLPLSAEPAGPGTGAAAGTPSVAARGVAAGMGLIMVANEILGPIGRNLQQQRRSIALGRARIDFWAQFGGNPEHRVWDIEDGRALALDDEAGTSWWGAGSFPYVYAIDKGSFASTLPTLIRTHRDFLLFMDMARLLGTIIEKPEMPDEPSADERREPRRYYAPTNAPYGSLRIMVDVTDIIEPLRDRLLSELDAAARSRLAGLDEGQRRNIFRLRRGSETPLYRSARGGQPILSDRQLLGDDPWVRTLGPELEGGAWQWMRHAQWRNLVLVAPANADAWRAAQLASYMIKETPDDVLEEVQKGHRPILRREPAEGDVMSFVAGPEPGESRFGETSYYRHPNWPDFRWTVAIGELRQFWVQARDLEPVGLAESQAYARGALPRPPAASEP